MTEQPMTGDQDGRTPWRATRCKATARGGAQCKQPAILGGVVCRFHGGASPQVKAAAERRHAAAVAEADAARGVALWGGRLDISPSLALLELVQGKAAEVAYWRIRVAELGESDLTYGVARFEDGVERGERTRLATEQAGPHVALQMLHKAEADLAQYSALAIRSGADSEVVARQAVEMAKRAGEQIAMVMRAVLADSRLGMTVSSDVVNAVCAEKIRALVAPEGAR